MPKNELPKNIITPRDNMIPKPATQEWGIHPEFIGESIRTGILKSMTPDVLEQNKASRIEVGTHVSPIRDSSFEVTAVTLVYNGSPFEPESSYKVRARVINHPDKFGEIKGELIDKPEEEGNATAIEKVVAQALMNPQAFPETTDTTIFTRIRPDHMVVTVTPKPYGRK